MARARARLLGGAGSDRLCLTDPPARFGDEDEDDDDDDDDEEGAAKKKTPRPPSSPLPCSRWEMAGCEIEI